MSVRAYVLLDIVDGKSEYAVQMLQNRAEVVLADWLEGSPDVIVMVEAPNRQGLAEAIMPVIGCIDGITEDLRLLVTRDEIPSDLSTPRNSRHAEERIEAANIKIRESERRQFRKEIMHA
jgi:hypothetical protein